MTEKYVAYKGTRQKLTRQNKWGRNGQSTWKIIQNSDSKDDLRTQNKGTDWEDTEMFNKQLEELKSKQWWTIE